MSGSSGRAQLGLAAVLFLLGFLASAALVQERLRERELPVQREALETLVARRQEAIRELARATRTLEDGLTAARTEAATGSAKLRELARRVEEAGALAGVHPMQGPGLVVTVADSHRVPATREETRDFRIQDVDLQALVNALWQAGAEAVALNGRRVISTTAVRQAGARILVNYGAVASPYRLVALGDPDILRAGLRASETGRRFEVWGQVYGLGFGVKSSNDLRVAALGSTPELHYASPERT